MSRRRLVQVFSCLDKSVNQILLETRLIARSNPDVITLPIERLYEFLLASVSNRCLTTHEIEEMRRACLRGEAKAWGVPVRFVSEV